MRWSVLKNKKSIVWNVSENDIHTDDIEMAGYKVSTIVTYGMTENGFTLMHHPAFPCLRKRPNDTHATYQLDFPEDMKPKIFVDGRSVTERLTRVVIDGTLTAYTDC